VVTGTMTKTLEVELASLSSSLFLSAERAKDVGERVAEGR
jgi:hypothetical protein